MQRYPNGNHLLLESQVGNRDEYPILQRKVPGYIEHMMSWIKQRTGGK